MEEHGEPVDPSPANFFGRIPRTQPYGHCLHWLQSIEVSGQLQMVIKAAQHCKLFSTHFARRFGVHPSFGIPVDREAVKRWRCVWRRRSGHAAKRRRHRRSIDVRRSRAGLATPSRRRRKNTHTSGDVKSDTNKKRPAASTTHHSSQSACLARAHVGLTSHTWAPYVSPVQSPHTHTEGVYCHTYVY